MSADTLRRAAALMRERAEHASDAPWRAHFGQSPMCLHDAGTYIWHRISAEGWDTGHARTNVAEADGPDDAQHIASWHPAVALAVALLLDNEASALEGGWGRENVARTRLLTDIAHAYLGEQP